jgi:hypothetical protein
LKYELLDPIPSDQEMWATISLQNMDRVKEMVTGTLDNESGEL